MENYYQDGGAIENTVAPDENERADDWSPKQNNMFATTIILDKILLELFDLKDNGPQMFRINGDYDERSVHLASNIELRKYTLTTFI